MDVQSDPPSRHQRQATILFGALLCGFGAFWAYSATQIRIRSTAQAITPEFLPFWVGVLLCVTGAAVAVVAWRERLVDEDPDDPFLDAPGQIRVWAFLAVLLVYTLLMEELHYLLLTFAAMLALLAIAREPVGVWLVVKAGATAAVMFLIFITVFDVPLPGSRYF